jgi:hypothetical protein
MGRTDSSSRCQGVFAKAGNTEDEVIGESEPNLTPATIGDLMLLRAGMAPLRGLPGKLEPPYVGSYQGMGF